MSNIQIQFKKLNKRLIKMRKRASNGFPLTGKISIIMHKDIMDHFAKEEGDTGRWKELSLATKKIRRNKKKASAKILQDTGTLRASIRPRNTKTEAINFTNVKYAKIHNEGGINNKGKKMPQRKFFWLSDKAKRLIDLIAGKFYIGS